MTALEEISAHLAGSSRAIVISEKDVDLRPAAPDNRLFLLKIGEGSLAAGGRGGGFGERKVTAVFCYGRSGGAWSKLYEAREDMAESFEVPYHVARLPMTMSDGTESMGYGVVDQELVGQLLNRAGISSS